MMKGGFFDTRKMHIKGIELSPLEFSSAILMDQWKSKPNEEEFTIMKIIVRGLQNDQPKTFTYDLFDTTDTVTETSSMSRTTGFTCTASLHLVMNKLFTEKGVFPPELVGKHENCFQYIMHYLNAHNVNYSVAEG
jgi:lysine 6-dehydrogenase